MCQRNAGEKTGALGDHKLCSPEINGFFFSFFLYTSIIKTHHTICAVFLFFACRCLKLTAFFAQ